jgi:RNA polymerase sigma-70 factor, ECF subfamily
VSRPAVRQRTDVIDFTLLRAEIVRFRAAPGRLPTPGLPPRPSPKPRPSPSAARPATPPVQGGGTTATAVAAGDTDTYAETELLSPDPTVADLVARSQAGEPEAFGLLYDRYVDLVYRYIYYRVGSPTLAEDLVSETFLRALRRIDSFTWQGRDFAAWLVTIARNLIADHFKSGRYRLEITTEDILESGPAQTTDGPESLVLDSLTNATLLSAVKQLNPEQQECIVLRFLQGLSVNETALAMGKNDGAIKALQYRAVRALARLLPEESIR